RNYALPALYEHRRTVSAGVAIAVRAARSALVALPSRPFVDQGRFVLIARKESVLEIVDETKRPPHGVAEHERESHESRNGGVRRGDAIDANEGEQEEDGHDNDGRHERLSPETLDVPRRKRVVLTLPRDVEQDRRQSAKLRPPCVFNPAAAVVVPEETRAERFQICGHALRQPGENIVGERTGVGIAPHRGDEL